MHQLLSESHVIMCLPGLAWATKPRCGNRQVLSDLQLYKANTAVGIMPDLLYDGTFIKICTNCCQIQKLRI